MWNVCSYLRHKHKLLILSRLGDFMTCREWFNIFSEGSLSQLWNLVYLLIRHSFTQIANIFHVSSNDTFELFYAAGKRIDNLSRGSVSQLQNIVGK